MGQIHSRISNSVFALHSEFKNVKLQKAYNAYDNSLHTHVGQEEYLYCTLLGDLLHSLLELLTLHGVYLLDYGKMLGSKRRNALKLYLQRRVRYSISYGEDTRVKYTDDIACVSLVDDLSFLCHHLLGLGELYHLTCSCMEIFLASLKLTRADSHKRNSVAVSLIHICLYFENKGGKMLVEGIYLSRNRLAD